jgi:hypothetical protein
MSLKKVIKKVDRVKDFEEIRHHISGNKLASVASHVSLTMEMTSNVAPSGHVRNRHKGV